MGEFEVGRLDGPFGAEILGLDPASVLGDDSIRRLRALFDEHGLLVFRNVDLDFFAQQALVDELVGAEPSLIGGKTVDGLVVEEYHVTNEVEGAYVGTGRLLFHSDAMWSDAPFELISLYGVRVDAQATPTMFANTERGGPPFQKDSLSESRISMLCTARVNTIKGVPISPRIQPNVTGRTRRRSD